MTVKKHPNASTCWQIDPDYKGESERAELVRKQTKPFNIIPIGGVVLGKAHTRDYCPTSTIPTGLAKRLEWCNPAYVEYLEAEIERLELENQRLKECQITPAI